MKKKNVFRWLKIIIIVYCLVGIAIYYLQDKYLFHPEPLPESYNYNFSVPFKEVNLLYNASTNINLVQFLTNDSTPKGVVLYFHGNRQNINRYAGFANIFTRNGYEVWMLDYPGFGKSTGEFTEQHLYDWALLTYKLARARFSPDSIVLYGKSLGTGVAAQLASVRDCKNLVLEAPYYSLPSIVGSYLPVYPVEKMIRFKMPTWQFLQKVTAPVTIFHGTSDLTIPYRNARKLQPFLKKEDQFITLEGGHHNDLTTYQQYQQTMDSLLKK
ncbi:MAG: alpha/beta fold hydrolase [Chitinophagaceae bacterium]